MTTDESDAELRKSLPDPGSADESRPPVAIIAPGVRPQCAIRPAAAIEAGRRPSSACTGDMLANKGGRRDPMRRATT